MNKNSLEDRMKENYENRSKTYLIKRTPVIIRLDGKAFHTFTKDFKRPYDNVFREAMHKTTKYLAANIQNCKLAYTQSDEISLLLIDFENITTDAWFDYSVQKMCSISASMATMAFNYFFQSAAVNAIDSFENVKDSPYWSKKPITEDENNYYKLAMFDARCFNIPKEEINNYFIWRQNDGIRNAIQMAGQTYLSKKELHKKSLEDILSILDKNNIDYESLPMYFKKGICYIKTGTGWLADFNIPIFKECPEYINSIIP